MGVQQKAHPPSGHAFPPLTTHQGEGVASLYTMSRKLNPGSRRCRQAPVQDVYPRPAEQDIIPVAAQERVVSIAADQHIITDSAVRRQLDRASR